LVAHYQREYETYRSFTEAVYLLLTQLLHEKGFRFHTIERRTKSLNSLGTKLGKSPEKYQDLSDISDLCGVRVITYFADDVDPIAAAIAEEFSIDWKRSEDKRKPTEPERFGYASLHYVANLSPNRKGLTEYKRFANLVVEIQLRSVLQHAWAEIEHDLGYKSPQAIPASIRHQFSRLAGLMELGDTEFMRIRLDLTTYQRNVSTQVKTAPSDVLIDRLSVQSLIASNKRVKELDQMLHPHVPIEKFEGRIESGLDWAVTLAQWETEHHC
jgi:putative GTP pyrophosphokinase